MTTKFIVGDCLDEIKNIDNATIDFIYFNPPYGITGCEYDKKLDWKNLWDEMWRVLTKKGIIAVHCSQPFTFDLICSQRKNLKYMWYWKKIGCAPTGHLWSKYQPMRCNEEVLIFYKKTGTYNPQMVLRDKPYSVKGGGARKSEYYANGQIRSTVINKTHNHPSHHLEFKRRNHPFSTRPIELCEYFIKTYSNEGDQILDLTCSDGQSALACINLKRNYIGVDLDPNMVELSQKRVEEHIQKLELIKPKN